MAEETNKTVKKTSTKPMGDGSGVSKSVSKKQSESASNNNKGSTTIKQEDFASVAERIMAKMTNEGQLVRNTGTNSIKSINDKLIKFQGVFDSISNEMQVQTATLKNIHNELMNEHDRVSSRDKLYDEHRRLQESEDREKDKKKKKPPKPITGGKPDNKSMLSGFLGNFLGGSVGFLLSMPIKAIAAVMGGIGANFVSDYFLQKAADLGISQKFLDAIAEPLKGGLVWGAIGMAFSKKLGLIGLAAGVAWPLADKVLEAAGFDPVSTVAGLQIGDIAGAILTGSFLYINKLMTSGMFLAKTTLSLGNKILTATVFNKELFNFIIKSRLGLSGLLLTVTSAFSDDVASFLSNFGLDKEKTEDVMNYTGWGASVGALFGPRGAVIGAGIGLVIGLGKMAFDWLNSNERKARKRMENATKLLDKVNDANFNGFTENELLRIDSLRKESLERGETELVKMYDSVIEKAKEKMPTMMDGQELRNLNNAIDSAETRNSLVTISKMPEEDKKSALEQLIKELRTTTGAKLTDDELLDRIQEQYDASGLKWLFSNTESVDISRLLMSAQNNEIGQPQMEAKLSGNGNNMISEKFHAEVMPEFKKTFGVDKIDLQNPDHLKWAQNNLAFREILRDANEITRREYEKNTPGYQHVEAYAPQLVPVKDGVYGIMNKNSYGHFDDATNLKNFKAGLEYIESNAVSSGAGTQVVTVIKEGDVNNVNVSHGGINTTSTQINGGFNNRTGLGLTRY